MVSSGFLKENFPSLGLRKLNELLDFNDGLELHAANDTPVPLKPGFHMIARIASDARIAQFCDQRSLRLNGNRFFKAAAILAILVILAIEIEKFLSQKCWRSLRQSIF